MDDGAAVALLARAVDALERIADALADRDAGAVDKRRAALVDELAEFFGDGEHASPFSARGLLMACEDSPRLAAALAALVDLNLPDAPRAVAVGRTLAAVPGLRPAGDRRGVRLWRCGGRGDDPRDPRGLGR
jgi:hypothetical protein